MCSVEPNAIVKNDHVSLLQVAGAARQKCGHRSAVCLHLDFGFCYKRVEQTRRRLRMQTRKQAKWRPHWWAPKSWSDCKQKFSKASRRVVCHRGQTTTTARQKIFYCCPRLSVGECRWFCRDTCGLGATGLIAVGAAKAARSRISRRGEDSLLARALAARRPDLARLITPRPRARVISGLRRAKGAAAAAAKARAVAAVCGYKSAMAAARASATSVAKSPPSQC